MVAQEVLRNAVNNFLVPAGQDVGDGQFYLFAGNGGAHDGVGGELGAVDGVVFQSVERILERTGIILHAIAFHLGEDDFAMPGAVGERADGHRVFRRDDHGFAAFEELERDADDVGVFRRKFPCDALFTAAGFGGVEDGPGFVIWR